MFLIRTAACAPQGACETVSVSMSTFGSQIAMATAMAAHLLGTTFLQAHLQLLRTHALPIHRSHTFAARQGLRVR